MSYSQESLPWPLTIGAKLYSAFKACAVLAPYQQPVSGPHTWEHGHVLVFYWLLNTMLVRGKHWISADWAELTSQSCFALEKNTPICQRPSLKCDSQNEHLPRWCLPCSGYNSNLTILVLGAIFLCNAVSAYFNDSDICSVRLLTSWT